MSSYIDLLIFFFFFVYLSSSSKQESASAEYKRLKREMMETKRKKDNEGKKHSGKSAVSSFAIRGYFTQLFNRKLKKKLK